MGLKRRFNNVGVLMGGSSAESEISLESGCAVKKALEDRGYHVGSLIAEDKIQACRLIEDSKVECVFIALHGGFGEDGTIQKLLDKMQIPYTGSGYEASSTAMNKIKSKKILEDNGLPVPTYLVLKDNNYDISLNGLSLPVVVKPSREGSSVGLSIIEKKDLLTEALKNAYRFNAHIIVEKYIKGREITVGILNDKPLPVVEIVPKRKFYDYKAKYTDGLTDYLVPAPIEEKISKKAQELAVSAHRAIKCHFFSRVDMRLAEDEEIYILEINSIPGLTGHSLLPKAAAAEGVSFEDLCQMILNSAQYLK